MVHCARGAAATAQSMTAGLGRAIQQISFPRLRFTLLFASGPPHLHPVRTAVAHLPTQRLGKVVDDVPGCPYIARNTWSSSLRAATAKASLPASSIGVAITVGIL